MKMAAVWLFVLTESGNTSARISRSVRWQVTVHRSKVNLRKMKDQF